MAKAKKTAKKTVKKAVKKTAKKAAKKSAKKVIKKAVKNLAKKPIAKAAKKAIKAAPQKKEKAQAKVAAAKKQETQWQSVLALLEDRILVQKTLAEKITAGGIIIPDSATSMVQGHLEGKILVVGKGKKNKKGAIRPLDVKVGDIIFFNEYSGTPIEVGGETALILRESEVLGHKQR